MRRSRDPLLLNRITLEFAGLCSRFFSAEGLAEATPEALVPGRSEKRTGYVKRGP